MPVPRFPENRAKLLQNLKEYMNNFFTALEDIDPGRTGMFGGKICSLAYLQKTGFVIPASYGLDTGIFKSFLKKTGLGRIIDDILKPKSLDEMRWEEIWDISLRIRNVFVKTRLPLEMQSMGKEAVRLLVNAPALAVRSSAPGEDAGATSFAGLHESHVPVQGSRHVRDAIVRVWSSLWSDRALLYRREIGLDPLKSSMAVLVQECVEGEYSGVAFTIDPTDETRMVIESVPGLNAALVDGSTPPARWVLERKSGRVMGHDPGPWDMDKDPLPDRSGLERIREMALRSEECFGRPQDVEWTMSKGVLYCLQSRPVTTAADKSASLHQADKRPWYLSLHRSFENLQNLRREIEEELLPALERKSLELSRIDVTAMDNAELAQEVTSRHMEMRRWRDIYYAKFIPMAHGVRLLGMLYNDALRPDDPFAFTALLAGTELEAMSRNRLLEAMAQEAGNRPELMRQLEAGDDWRNDPANAAFINLFDEFYTKHGSLMCSSAWCTEGEHGLISLILEMAGRQSVKAAYSLKKKAPSAEQQFFDAFSEERLDFARQVLELARASHAIRDNDNMAMGRLQVELVRAVDEGRQRVLKNNDPIIVLSLKDIPEEYLDVASPTGKSSYGSTALDQEQNNVFKGHPAGPGVAHGPARVVMQPSDLFAFRQGDVLVCEAMDPGMSFVVPLAAAIVEARGGMLVHGAIIAREYGLPCVTGLSRTIRFIKNGDLLMVDGYKGTVTREQSQDSEKYDQISQSTGKP